MQLPNAERAIVSEEKAVDYLLNSLHPEGASKAKFFQSLGFDIIKWRLLADELKNLAIDSSVVSYLESVHGQKYIIEGAIETPCGRRPSVRTVWIVDLGETIPRLVTAYPCDLDS
jgi:hypothetical protein